MRRIFAAESILSRIQSSNRFNVYPRRPFCSSIHDKNSISNYKEQYKALDNLDFMTAAKILFSETPNKKKFGLDFHLVQLLFVCLPSLAVYLVAQYARSEMKKMDAELERKKQAEFEAQAKEMELKAAEEKAAAASAPELLEVKERLDKLEMTVKEIALESKKQSGDAITTGNEQRKATKVETNTIHKESTRQ